MVRPFIMSECVIKNEPKETYSTVWNGHKIYMKLSRGEICVANLKAPLQMVLVWVVNKFEKNVLEAKGWKQHNLQTLKYGWAQRNNIRAISKNWLLPNGPKWADPEDFWSENLI